MITSPESLLSFFFLEIPFLSRYLVLAVIFPLWVRQTLTILSTCGALLTKVVHLLDTVCVVC
jgi:hypothetical protein